MISNTFLYFYQTKSPIGECVGYVDVPASVGCVGSYPTTRRLCNCDDPNTASHTAAFGSGTSSFMNTLLYF
jgi:hypothetical protein